MIEAYKILMLFNLFPRELKKIPKYEFELIIERAKEYKLKEEEISQLWTWRRSFNKGTGQVGRHSTILKNLKTGEYKTLMEVYDEFKDVLKLSDLRNYIQCKKPIDENNFWTNNFEDTIDKFTARPTREMRKRLQEKTNRELKEMIEEIQRCI